MSDENPKAESNLRQDADDQPFLVWGRKDGTFAAAAHEGGNLISLAPLIAIPDKPKNCPHCGLTIEEDEP